MRIKTFSISEISDIITRLPERLEQEEVQLVTVTQHGKPVMTILPYSSFKELTETLDSLLETIEVMQDKELMAALYQGMKDLEEGRVIPWEQVKKELGWE